jgi:hypothetical protein
MSDRAKSAGTLVLLGGGQHAAVVAESASAAGWGIAGFFDDDPQCTLGSAHTALRLLGTIADAPSFLATPTGSPAVHAATGDPQRRRRWLEIGAEWPAPPVVHPSAVVNPSVRIGDRTILGAGAVAVHDLDDDMTAMGVPARAVAEVGLGGPRGP